MGAPRGPFSWALVGVGGALVLARLGATYFSAALEGALGRALEAVAVPLAGAGGQ